MRANRFEEIAGVAQLVAVGPAMVVAVLGASVVSVVLGVAWGLDGDPLGGPSLDIEAWLFDPDTQTTLSDPDSFDMTVLFEWIPPWLLYASTWVQSVAMLLPALGLAGVVGLARQRLGVGGESLGRGLRRAFGVRAVSARWLAIGLGGGLAVSWFPSLVLSLVVQVVELDNTTGELLASAITRSTRGELALGVGSIVFAVPLFEELLFRGYGWSIFERWTHPVVPFAVTTLAFALLHGSPLHILGVLTIGLWLGWLRWRSGSVWPSVCSHVANNGVAMAVVLLAGSEAAAPTLVDGLIGVGSAALVVWLAIVAGRTQRGARPTPS